jgi:hypothetical protein
VLLCATFAAKSQARITGNKKRSVYCIAFITNKRMFIHHTTNNVEANVFELNDESRKKDAINTAVLVSRVCLHSGIHH